MSTSMSGSSGFRPPKANLKGTGYNQTQMSNWGPEQMQLMQQMLGNVGPNSYMNKLAQGDESTFNQIEAPEMQKFGAMQGNVASRFSGMGMGGRKSSGFQNAMSTANQDFASQLRSQRMGLQQQAIQSLHGMSNDLLGQRPYENVLMPKKRPFWQEMSLAGIEGLGHIGGTALGNF